MKNNFKARFNIWCKPFTATLVTLIVTLSIMTMYVAVNLEGNFKHIFLPSSMFGVPQQVEEHGYDTFFNDGYIAGWDGQFYFYIANDPFARKDTVNHIDANAYRYQRVGLPLIAKLASKILFQSWVSPATYYLTSLSLVLMATLIAATYFQYRNISPYWILFWSLGLGTQLTQLHGLPDAAADGLLIIGLISLLRGWRLVYVIALAFSGLSREIYVLVPSFIFCVELLCAVASSEMRKSLFSSLVINFIKRSWIHIIPILVMVGWQLFIRFKFGVSPSSQAPTVLGWPLISAVHYLLGPFFGTIPLNHETRLESWDVLLFLILLSVSLFVFAKFAWKRLRQIGCLQSDDVLKLGIGFAFLSIVCVYFCFGSTVMEWQPGFWKAANILFFALPFVVAMKGGGVSKWLILFFIITTLYSSHVMIDRLGGYSNVSYGKVAYANFEPACLKEYNVKITPKSFELMRNTFLRRLTNSHVFAINVEIKNLGGQDLVPYRGKGGVVLSYRLIRVDNGDITRAKDFHVPLVSILHPGEVVIRPVYIDFPSIPGDYLLKLTLLQEGCAWFDEMNPASSFTLPYKVR